MRGRVFVGFRLSLVSSWHKVLPAGPGIDGLELVLGSRAGEGLPTWTGPTGETPKLPGDGDNTPRSSFTPQTPKSG